MKKRFNITGVCVPNMHYMVDISNKIKEIEELVDYGHYFTINRPRQYGKTTTLNTLAQKLREKYIVIKTSFEGSSDNMFESEENFCSQIFELFADSIGFMNPELAAVLRKYQKGIDNYNTLSREITRFVREMAGPLQENFKYLCYLILKPKFYHAASFTFKKHSKKYYKI